MSSLQQSFLEGNIRKVFNFKISILGLGVQNIMSDMDVIQKGSLELLKTLDEICEHNNLRYYIIGGTLLGAVRHKGFIPWDDDIDVAMPRKDYNFLLEHSEELFINSCKLLHYSNCDDKLLAQCMFIKLMNKKTSVEIEQNGKIIKSNIFLDIFPLDGTPDNWLLRKFYFFRLLFHRALYKFTFSDVIEIDNGNDRSLFEKILIKFSKITHIGKLIDPQKERAKLKNLLEKYDCDKSKKMAGTFLGAYKLREFTDVKYFRNRKKYQFEDGEFYGTDDYDGYLTCIYGDYMQLPPEEKRIGKHKIVKVEEIE